LKTTSYFPALITLKAAGPRTSIQIVATINTSGHCSPVVRLY
jgi:hypothetical protein